MDYEQLLELLKTRYVDLIARKRYTSMNLPIVSNSLIEICKKECERLSCTWGSESDLRDEYLIHKHKLRKRNSVIANREKAKKKRS